MPHVCHNSMVATNFLMRLTEGKGRVLALAGIENTHRHRNFLSVCGWWEAIDKYEYEYNAHIRDNILRPSSIHCLFMVAFLSPIERTIVRWRSRWMSCNCAHWLPFVWQLQTDLHHHANHELITWPRPWQSYQQRRQIVEGVSEL